MPFAIDWPEMIYKESETTFTFVTDEGSIPFFKTDIKLIDPTEEGDLKFEICSDNMNINLELIISNENYEFSVVGDKSISVKWRRKFQSLKSFFYDNPPIISFVDGSTLEGSLCTELRKEIIPYEKKKIKTWNWKEVDITKEPQGKMKEASSIQYKVIRELEKGNYDIILDDHDKGEAADVVCVSDRQKIIMVEFYHCKSSQTPMPGRRVDDLSEVCSQAQRSVRWMDKKKKTELFDHLLRREALRESQNGVSRFERGNKDELWQIKEKSREIPVELKIFIVQPGLSKLNASVDQLVLLSVTENYLNTYQVPFKVIASS